MSMKTYVAKVRKLVIANRKLWRDMDRDRVVSYSYLVRFAAGEYENPGALTLEAIEKYITAKVAA